MNTIKASIDLFELIEVVNKSVFSIADKEHFTQRMIKTTRHNTAFDLLVPAISNTRVHKIQQKCEYHPLWAGYATAEADFSFANAGSAFRMTIQREGET